MVVQDVQSVTPRRRSASRRAGWLARLRDDPDDSAEIRVRAEVLGRRLRGERSQAAAERSRQRPQTGYALFAMQCMVDGR